jgi:hypothetical protein
MSWSTHLQDTNPSLALSVCYPEHSFQFGRKRVGHWKDITNQRAFFDQLASKLNIHKLEDWCHVNVKTVVQQGGSFVFYHYNGSLLRGK